MDRPPPTQTLAALLDDPRFKAVMPVDAIIDAGHALRAVATELAELREFKAQQESDGAPPGDS